MSYDSYLPMDQVDDTASYTEMQGPSSGINQLTGPRSWLNSPTKALTVLWGVILGLYWLVGFIFRGSRS